MATAIPTFGRNSSTNSLYLDDKWKLSKKESLSRSRNKSITSSSLVKNNNNNNSSGHKRCAFTRKCAKLVKEQRARFYIMRRCVTMLICWHHYTDESD